MEAMYQPFPRGPIGIPRLVRVAFFVLAGLTSAATASAASLPDATPTEAPLTGWGDFEGVWLRTEAAEAFVSLWPMPRVLVFQEPGGDNQLDESGHRYVGVRTWFMEPVETKQSGLPSSQPAKLVEYTPASATVRAETDSETLLQNELVVTVDADSPVLRITHRIYNRAEIPRTLSAWGIVAVAPGGTVIMPLHEEGAPGQTITYFKTSDPKAPQLAYGTQCLTLNTRFPNEHSPFIKIGGRNSRGLIGYLKQGQILAAHTPFAAQAIYPEGGANVTTYFNGTVQRTGWAEIENVGPLESVPPGHAASLTQTLSLHAVPEDSPENDPDHLHELLLQQDPTHAVETR